MHNITYQIISILSNIHFVKDFLNMDQGLGSIHRKKNLFLVKLPLAMKTSQNGNVSVWANLERVDQEKINLIQRSNLRFANILYHVHNEVKLFLIEHSYFLAYASGWAPWNLSCLEFKFDDNRLSYWHKNKIGRIHFFFVASWLC